MTVEQLLPANYRDKAAEYEKGTDTMDVWFDSGTIIFWCQMLFNFHSYIWLQRFGQYYTHLLQLESFSGTCP